MPTRTYIFLSSGSFALPADIDPNGFVTFKVVGGGAGGGIGPTAGTGAPGGGGGAVGYWELDGANVAGGWAPGQVIYFQVGAGGTSGSDGTASWVNRFGNSQPGTYSSGAYAGGGYAPTNGVDGGLGGSTFFGEAGGNGAAIVSSGTSTGGGGAGYGSGAFDFGTNNINGGDGGDAATGGGGLGATTAGANGQNGTVDVAYNGTVAGLGGGGAGRSTDGVGGAGGYYGAGGGGGRGNGQAGGVGRQGYVRITVDTIATAITLGSTEKRDTAAFSGNVSEPRVGFQSQAFQVSAFQVNLTSTAALSASESLDTASVAVNIPPSFNLATTEASDIASIVAQVYSTLSLAAAESQDAAAFNASFALTGSVSAIEDKDAASVEASVIQPAALWAIEPSDSAALTITIDSVLAQLEATEQVDTAEASALVTEPPHPLVSTPTYANWLKAKKKPKAPELPPPVNAGEIVIDEAVLRQMEEERLTALVLQKKQNALDRVDKRRGAYKARPQSLRSIDLNRQIALEEMKPPFRQTVSLAPRTEEAPAPAPARQAINLNRQRFDVLETTAEVRRQVVNLLREQPEAPAKDTVRGVVTLHTLGAHNSPRPEIRNTRTISLRRSNDRQTQTGL